MILLKRLDNRGVSLIELMISMAILAIVSMVIALFMYTGSKSYHYAKTNTDVQKESQILLAQIRDMALQSNCYKYDATNHAITFYELTAPIPTVEPTGTALPASTALPAATPTVKGKQVVYWNSGKKKLYYAKFADDATPSYTTNKDNLMGDYVTGFKAKYDEENNVLVVTLKMKEGNYEYTTDQKIHMRNDKVELP